MKLPLVIYFDFESVLKPLPNQDLGDNRTVKTHFHQPFSFGYYIKCNYDNILSRYRSYRGADVPEIFVKWLEDDVKQIYQDHLKPIVPK